MGLEFSSANLNNQMWEQKNEPPPPPPPPPPRSPRPTHRTAIFNPPPQASSLFPPARSSHKRSSVRPKLLLGSPYGAGRGREEEWSGVGGGVGYGGGVWGAAGPVYLIRQNRRLLITTPFSQQAAQPHPASVNMERRASQSPQHSLSSNGRIKTV